MSCYILHHLQGKILLTNIFLLSTYCIISLHMNMRVFDTKKRILNSVGMRCFIYKLISTHLRSDSMWYKEGVPVLVQINFLWFWSVDFIFEVFRRQLNYSLLTIQKRQYWKKRRTQTIIMWLVNLNFIESYYYRRCR